MADLFSKKLVKGSHSWVKLAEEIILPVAQSTCASCRSYQPDREPPDVCEHARARFLLHGPAEGREK